MSKLWNLINKIDIKNTNKNRLFILSLIFISGISGGLVWLVAGQIYLPGIDWLLCFAGYPAIFIGFFAGMFYLYRHEFGS